MRELKLFNQSVKDKFSFRAIGGSLEAVGADEVDVFVRQVAIFGDDFFVITCL